MNIFVLDANPITAARFHNDRHVVKMILESCQLLATAHHKLDGRVPARIELRPTHGNHPCSLWVRSSADAYRWLHMLCGGLLMEFRERYGHPHSYVETWERLFWAPAGNDTFNEPGYYQHPLCMPAHCKVEGDPVRSYRNYYIREKQHLASWYHGDASKVPNWFKMKEAA